MNCRRGDIVLILFPDSNRTIVAMHAGYPSRVVVRVAGQRANASGLLMDSVIMTIMTDNLATVHYLQLWCCSLAGGARQFHPPPSSPSTKPFSNGQLPNTRVPRWLRSEERRVGKEGRSRW